MKQITKKTERENKAQNNFRRKKNNRIRKKIIHIIADFSDDILHPKKFLIKSRKDNVPDFNGPIV